MIAVLLISAAGLYLIAGMLLVQRGFRLLKQGVPNEKRLGALHLVTGALFYALPLLALERGISLPYLLALGLAAGAANLFGRYWIRRSAAAEA